MITAGYSTMRWLATGMVTAMLAGCASNQTGEPTEAQQQFAAGQEEAFAMLQRSGIPVVRVVGPFERPAVQWEEEMTLTQVILAAGYLDDRDPRQILIQRGRGVIPIDPVSLLSGKDVAVEPGDVIHIHP